jgi:hypothetical protein
MSDEEYREFQALREWKESAAKMLDRYTAAVDETFEMQPGESRIETLENALAKLRRMPRIKCLTS